MSTRRGRSRFPPSKPRQAAKGPGSPSSSTAARRPKPHDATRKQRRRGMSRQTVRRPPAPPKPFSHLKHGFLRALSCGGPLSPLPLRSAWVCGSARSALRSRDGGTAKQPILYTDVAVVRSGSGAEGLPFVISWLMLPLLLTFTFGCSLAMSTTARIGLPRLCLVDRIPYAR